jgi:hypothetical protein
MKLLFCAVATLAAAANSISAAPSVTFTNALDMTVAVTKSYSATYVPVSDKYLIGGPTAIQVFNGVTGANEGTLSNTGITPSDLGFFAVTSDADGKIYAVEIGGADIWRWDSASDANPEKVYGAAPDAALFARIGSTGSGSGPNINVAFTGSADDGPVQFFKDDGTTFTFVETVPMTAKSALTINKAATIAFTTGDTGGAPINKWIKTGGVWAQDTTTWVPTRAGAGPMAYDEINDVLFIHPEVGGLAVYALDGTTGAEIGTASTVSQLNGTAGYNGAFISPAPQAGTLWMAGRAAGGDTNSALYKWTYVYTPDARVADWTMY